MTETNTARQTTTIGEIVPLLIDLLERSTLPRSPAQVQVMTHLKSIGEYLARRHVDAWDDAVPPDSDDDVPFMADLLEAVHELGRSNLYTMFSPERTLREYAVVAAKFLEAGLSPPQIDAITDW